MSEKPFGTSSTPPMRIATSKLKTNPNNPRSIRKDQLQKLVKSLREFPEMLEARPIVVDPDFVVLGGNMRLKAAQEAGLKEVPVYIASWEEAKHKEFIIKDNLSLGSGTGICLPTSGTRRNWMNGVWTLGSLTLRGMT